jgi:hypothetical protein
VSRSDAGHDTNPPRRLGTDNAALGIDEIVGQEEAAGNDTSG